MNIESVTYGLIKALIGSETLIFSEQNAPRPELPYWTIRIQSTNGVGLDEKSNGVDDDGNQKLNGHREAIINIERIGVASDDKCLDLVNDLAKVTVIDAWRAAKVSVFDIGNIMRVPYAMDSDHLEPRAIVDLSVRFGSELLDNVGIIETVESTGTIN